MTATRVLGFITALVVVAGLLLQGDHVLTRQRSQLAAARQRTESLSAQLAAQARTRDATLSELSLAEKQLAEFAFIRPPVTAAHSSNGDAEFASWIARVKRLQELVEQHPDQRIPEMRLLTDDDWLTVARNRKLESDGDVRPALAAIRTAAKDRFVPALVEAMRRFNAAATPDQTANLARPGPGGTKTTRTPPATALELAPYLENAADAEVLMRLTVFATNSGWKLQEKDALDPEYDGGYKIYSDIGVHGGVAQAPWAWLPPDFDERSLRANRAYLAAHNDMPSASYADVFPYFDPPLDPEAARRILRAVQQEAK